MIVSLVEKLVPNLQRVSDHKIGPQYLSAYAWPGGYPLFYIVDDGEIICPSCANGGEFTTDQSADDDGFKIVGADANWEDPNLYCGHCNITIETAYGAADDT